MYCTIEDIKSYSEGENKTIQLKDVNEKNNDKAFEIDNINIDEYGDIILEFNPEYLIDQVIK